MREKTCQTTATWKEKPILQFFLFCLIQSKVMFLQKMILVTSVQEVFNQSSKLSVRHQIVKILQNLSFMAQPMKLKNVSVQFFATSCNFYQILNHFFPKQIENIVNFAKSLTCQSEAFFLPIFTIVNTRPNNFLNQILWICSFNCLGIFHRSICHFQALNRIKN